MCSPYPNIHLVNNENITEECLYDNKHIKRRQIGILVANIKDVTFNRMKRANTSTEQSKTRRHFHDRSSTFVTDTSFKSQNKINSSHPILLPGFPQQQFQHDPRFLTSPNRNPLTTYYDDQRPTYASITNTPKTNVKPSNTSLSLNAESVLELLKLYETMRRT
jgi:hypothetical protein